MGDFFKGGYNPKAGLRLIGIDMDASAKAAKDQANAIRESAAATARQAAYAAQGAQEAIQTASAQRIASQEAQDLLGAPLKVAEVDTTPDEEDENDLLRRRGIRSTYQARDSAAAKSSGLNI